MKNLTGIYIGKRLIGEKIYDTFKIGKETAHFQKLGWLTIGGEYELIGSDLDKVRCSRHPPWIRQAVADEEQLEKWRAEQLLAEEFVRRKKFAKQSTKSETLKKAADILKPLVLGLRMSQRQKVVEILMDEIEREERAEFSRKTSLALKRAAKSFNKSLAKERKARMKAEADANKAKASEQK